jgi:hypothetical protein
MVPQVTRAAGTGARRVLPFQNCLAIFYPSSVFLCGSLSTRVLFCPERQIVYTLNYNIIAEKLQPFPRFLYVVRDFDNIPAEEVV